MSKIDIEKQIIITERQKQNKQRSLDATKDIYDTIKKELYLNIVIVLAMLGGGFFFQEKLLYIVAIFYTVLKLPDYKLAIELEPKSKIKSLKMQLEEIEESLQNLKHQLEKVQEKAIDCNDELNELESFDNSIFPSRFENLRRTRINPKIKMR